MIDKNTGEIIEKPTGAPKPFYVAGKNVARKVIHPKCDENMAKQEFKKEADINYIMDRYKQTGLLPQQVTNVQAHFANFANVDDYYTACTKAAAAQMAFDALPAKMRKIFDNDPGKLVAFVSDSKNELAAAQMGLLTKEAAGKAFEKARNAQKARDEKIISTAEAKKAATKVAKQDPKES